MTKKDKRQPRQTREELRSLLLETGRTILREDGLGTGAESLTFKRSSNGWRRTRAYG